MNSRSKTRWLVALAAMTAFATHQAPDDMPRWVNFLLGILNAGLIAALGMREPGSKGKARG